MAGAPQRPMTADLLRRAGEALWGSRWQTEMARALDISERTVRRWASGDYPPPPGVWSDLAGIAGERHGALAHLSRELRRHVTLAARSRT